MNEPPAGPPTPPQKPPDTEKLPEEAASSLSQAQAHAETQEYQAKPGLTPPAPATPPPPRHAALPKAFGRYEVVKVLGSGAYGTVYLGHDHQLDRAVAIKVHRADRELSGDSLNEFQQEARRLAKLKHPGIVAVYDFGSQDDHVYIVSDYVQGTTLRERIKHQSFTWRESVRIVAALADALAHAHAQRTVHRDIKPANIILTPEQKPVLVDFGLGIDESEMHGGQLGMVAGTPAYMSPEQTTGKGHRIDGRTDIYALGVVLYELLTGHLPFRSPNHDELIRQVREDDPQPPRQLVPHLPKPLEQICLKALAKQQQDRFITAADMAEELLQLVAGQDPGRPAGPGSMQESVSMPTISRVAPKPGDSGQKTLESSSRRRDAERRQITLLACSADLFESAEYIENLDYEEQHEIKTAYQEICAGVIKRFGGTVIQMTEKETLACFGYPIAYEDAALRAVRTGLGILKDLAPLHERLQRDKQIAFTTTVHVHTGMAVVSETPEGPGREAFSVVGEARNVISRLDAVARPDAVVISQATHRLVQGFFECESLGTTPIKGVSTPLEFLQVRREKEAQNRIDVAVPTGLSPLVGRDREVGLLQDRWEQTGEGMGQIVLLVGDAGLGKSRLVHVIKEHVSSLSSVSGKGGADLSSPSGRGVDGSRSIVEWRCSPQHLNSGLYPAIDFFERRLGFERDEAPPAKFAKLREHLRAHGMDGDEFVPFFAALLSVPLSDLYTPIALSPARQKEKTFDAILEWMRITAERAPFLFVIEDLHWMDPSTLELLARHVESSTSERILTLLTFRPEFETPWKGKAHQTVMALTRLTRKQITDLMQRMSGVTNLAPALVEQIAAKTDGVPLFVEEYTQMMIEASHQSGTGGPVTLSTSFFVQQIPATLHDLLMARLDRMASNREVVQIAAALGREFSYELIRAVWTQEETALRTELDKLVAAELLYQKGKPPQGSYLFKHALIQDSAYQSLLKSKRQQVHRRVAVALEKQFVETVQHQPELLAHHFTEAGLLPEAVAYWTKAGLRSQERSANAEAASHLRRGLELLAALPDTPERAAQELGMQVPLGTVLIASEGYAAPEVGPVFARARELCVQIGQPVSLMAVLWGVWAWRVVREEFDACLELSREVMQLADTHADDGLRMEAHFVPGLTLYYRGDFVKAREHLEAGLALYDAERCRQWSRYTGQNAGATARSYLALALWSLGYPDQALRVGQEGVRLANEIAHPFTQCYAIHHFGWLQQHLRLGKETQASAEQELRIAGEQGFLFWKAVGALSRSAALLLQNKPAEALEQATQGLAAFRATGAALSLAHYLGYIAEAHRQLRHFDEARTVVDEAIAAAGKNHNDFFLAELYGIKGNILLEQTPADPVEAEACFQDSLAVAAKQQAKSWELRTTMNLCRLWQKQCRQAEARDRLAAVYGWFTEGFETPDLRDARKLLADWT
jgi:TOMM system kinase/cyclase fusion protein